MFLSWQKKILKNLNRCPKNCVLCEEWVLFKAPLCRDCRKYLFQQTKTKSHNNLHILDRRCYFLWSWNDQNHRWIQKVVLAMKDGCNHELYKIFMPWLINTINQFEGVKQIVAIPSLDRKHPEKLIEVFQFFKHGITTFTIFKNSSKAQKYKSKIERLNVEFEFGKSKDSYSFKTLDSLYEFFRIFVRTSVETEVLPPKLSKRRLLIIDDVVSTGSSMRGAMKLVKPRHVHSLAVWAYKVRN